MTKLREDIEIFCEEQHLELLLADGFDEAFLGVGNAFHNEPVAIYDRNKCIDILADDFKRAVTPSDTSFHNDETDFYEQALEYFDYNVQGSYVGEKTPIFITPFS